MSQFSAHFFQLELVRLFLYNIYISSTRASWRRCGLIRVPRSDLDEPIQRAFLSSRAGTIISIQTQHVQGLSSCAGTIISIQTQHVQGLSSCAGTIISIQTQHVQGLSSCAGTIISIQTQHVQGLSSCAGTIISIQTQHVQGLSSCAGTIISIQTQHVLGFIFLRWYYYINTDAARAGFRTYHCLDNGKELIAVLTSIFYIHGCYKSNHHFYSLT